MAEANQEAVSTWLDDKEREFPNLLHGGKKGRFRELVEKYQLFPSLLQASRQPRRSVAERNHVADQNAEHHGSDVRVAGTSSETAAAATTNRPSHGAFLHAVTMIGCCVTLQNLLKEHIDVDEPADDGITALHIATAYGKYEDTEVLLNAEAEIKADSKGLTPLHVAALSHEPNPQIAKLLIKHMLEQNEGGELLINAQVVKTRNTALHFAAENEHISHEFIQALESIDPSISNNSGETAFHVAARAENPEVIVFMLEVFTPAETRWKITDIESEGKPTLLEICARRGNAKAVAMLIKCGADIYENVLFHIIDESVNNPAMTEKLVSVYRTITENCVLWERLKIAPDKRFEYPRKAADPDAYGERQREIMLKLLNSKNSKDRNVLEHAIAAGAEVFLREIVDTPNVYKMMSEENDVSEVKYDVTDFITSRERPSCCQLRRYRRTAPVSSDSESPENESQPDAGKNSAPNEFYLLMITCRPSLWENKDIFHVEPFLTMTEPICALAKLMYLLIALIQLTYMICFSVYYLPPHCSLTSTYGSVLAFNNSNAKVPCKPFPIEYTSLWLIWPMLVSVFYSYVNVTANKKLWHYLFSPAFGYPLIIILWQALANHDRWFLSVTSLVHLIGWLFTLSLFIRSLEKVTIFLFLLTDIIAKDILLSFGIVFVFILVSFSSAVHVLRYSAIVGIKTYSDTLYNLFAAALTTGSFIKETLEDKTNGMHPFLLTQMRATFAIFLCFATIILLNILISIVNNLHEGDRQKAQNVWRFHTVRAGVYVMHIINICFPKILVGFRTYWKIFRKIPVAKVTKHDDVSFEEVGDFMFMSLRYLKPEAVRKSAD